ncbi:putative membrane protein [Bartonella bovis 91-4]|uniref:Putative membrane protein n=2 Tax=Bartonella bovis TaxID=155194 RepID=N6UF33_9HYPH|nr:putative membrane protein [Bartonella bovis 91-4]
MFKKIRTVVIYSVGFAVLQFLQIEKNTEFIQAVLIFSSLAILVTMVFIAAFFRSRVSSELHHNPQHQHKTTTDLNILTVYLREYLYSFLHIVFIALLLLLLPSNLRQDIVLPFFSWDSKWEFHFYWDVLLWYFFLIFVSDIALQMRGFINSLVHLFNLNAVYSPLE